jgi:SprT protein
MTTSALNNDPFYLSLNRFLPPGTSELLPPLLEGRSVLLKVKPARSTKFGDYRPLKDKKHLHQITINNDLNPYAFMVTLLHEIAHLHAFEVHKNKVKPHGQEWKGIYSEILSPFISLDYLPDDVYKSLLAHINGPTASSCSDHTLFQALKKYNPANNGMLLLEALPHGSHFVWRNGQVFEKADKVRKRYRCIDVKTKRIWFFHPMAEIELLG